MDATIAPTDAPPTPIATPAAPRYYVPLPQRLLRDLRDTPLAIGIYALIARTFRRTHAPVPLSAADLSALDSSLSRGAATRALHRLRDAGYVISATQPGRKTAYTPAWGRVRDMVVAWDLGAACVGRPRHIYELRLAQELLDACVGQLTPHPRHAAQITRLVGHPLLTLRDVGAYALISADLPATSVALEELGLMRDGQAQPVPPAATILAVATQRTWGDSAALTDAGWAQTSFAPQPAPAEGDGATPLFFVPVDRVGAVIGGEIAPLIGQPAPSDGPSAAAGRAIPPAPPAAVGSQERESKIDSTTGGGGDPPSSDSATPAPTESYRMLRDLQINTRVAASFADAPVSAVTQAIARARATPGVRDQARWIVGVLRDWQTRGWSEADAPPAPATPARVSDSPILFHPNISGRERQIWLSRFRAADPADRQAILDRFFMEFGHVPAS